MSEEKMILGTYMMLKDCLEDDDDFEKMRNLIKQMANIDAEKAFDMWYPLLRKYENIVTKKHVNETYYFVNENLDVLEKALGASRLDEMVLRDKYLYDLLIKRFCYSLNHYNYTQKMLMRVLDAGNFDLADRIFADAYTNGNNSKSWFEIIDGFISDIKPRRSRPSPNKKVLSLISKWAAKVEGQKDKAKVMSAMLATGLEFDYDVLQQPEVKKGKTKGQVQRTQYDSSRFRELLSKYPGAIKDRQKLKALLSDYYPENKLYTNIILMVLDEGLLEEIRWMSNSDFLKKQRLVARLVNNYGISEDLADVAIEAWYKGLN